ncbi:hypothetical protein C3L33_18843, partial [Rhododendron williamsianum]
MRRYAHTTSLLLLLFFMFHLVVSEIPSNQRTTMINSIISSKTTRPNLLFLGISAETHIDTLESIDLSNNYLSSIPSEFMTYCGMLGGLRGLNFSWNILSGSLPNFDGFLKLEYLDLSHNSLSRTISLQMDGLVSLKLLSLGYNQFSGSVPTHLGKSMVLERLVLYYNHFVGKIPEDIANYSNLIEIDLSYNNLSGSIPDRFRELPNLQVLFYLQ